MKQTIFRRYVTGFLELVEKHKQPGMVVAEVGAYDGSTTGVVAPVVKEMNGKYIAIDWFKGNQTIPRSTPGNSHGYDENQHDVVLEDFNYNIEQIGCSNIVRVIDSPSIEAASQIEDKSLDICFIDADHRYKAVKADILAYISKVKDGGILSGHDLNEGSEIHFNTWSDEELEQDMARGCHAGVTQAIGEIIGFEKIVRYPNEVWAVRINKNREFEKL
jgi:predicted O-methyltransferase YrrM